jgi:hypothetical protein
MYYYLSHHPSLCQPERREIKQLLTTKKVAKAGEIRREAMMT